MSIKQLLAQSRMYDLQERGEVIEPASVSLDLTPEGIAKMDKAELIDLLEAHGVAADKRKGRDTLADELMEVVFV